VFVLIAVVLFVSMHLTGGNLAHVIDHGMGAHTPTANVSHPDARQP
jgi:hypothetical protein